MPLKDIKLNIHNAWIITSTTPALQKKKCTVGTVLDQIASRTQVGELKQNVTN
jgi:hypothetical protein